jgi:hypothetical protein
MRFESLDFDFGHRPVLFSELLEETVEGRDQTGYSLREFRFIEEQDTAGHWHLPHNLTHGRDAIV